MTGAAAPSPPPRRVLLIKPSSLGDVVTALPVLRGLRRTFPEAHVSWLLSSACAPLLAGDGDLDEVILFERRRLGRAWRSPAAAGELLAFLKTLRRGQFDWIIDLQGLFRSAFFAWAAGGCIRAGFADAREGAWLFYTHRCRPARPHTVDRNIDLAGLLGIEARPEDMTLHVAPEGRDFAETFRRRSAGGGEFLLCVPPTRWPTKQYPVRHWRAVAGELSRRMPVALLGAPGDRAMCREIARGQSRRVVDLAGETTIPQMVGLIAAASAVVCSDSAAKFIAPAVGTRAVTLIGPTRLELTGPYPAGRAVVADVPCQGCLRRHCRHITCMELIEPGAVISAVGDVLDRRKDPCPSVS